MPASLSGLSALIERLRTMPAELSAEARAIVEDSADAAYTEMFQAYPPGGLRDGTEIQDNSSGFTARFAVVNTAKHARFYEYGSQTIRYTKTGASRGVMPAYHTAKHAETHQRAPMYAALEAMLDRHDLTVNPGELT